MTFNDKGVLFQGVEFHFQGVRVPCKDIEVPLKGMRVTSQVVRVPTQALRMSFLGMSVFFRLWKCPFRYRFFFLFSVDSTLPNIIVQITQFFCKRFMY